MEQTSPTFKLKENNGDLTNFCTLFPRMQKRIQHGTLARGQDHKGKKNMIMGEASKYQTNRNPTTICLGFLLANQNLRTKTKITCKHVLLQLSSQRD